MREHEEHNAAIGVRGAREWRQGLRRIFILLDSVGWRMLRRRLRLPLARTVYVPPTTNRYPSVCFLC